MTIADARARADDAIALMNQMNSSYEHIPSKDKAALAPLVLDLCAQLEAAQGEIAALRAIAAPAGVVAASDAHLGGVGE